MTKFVCFRYSQFCPSSYWRNWKKNRENWWGVSCKCCSPLPLFFHVLVLVFLNLHPPIPSFHLLQHLVHFLTPSLLHLPTSSFLHIPRITHYSTPLILSLFLHILILIHFSHLILSQFFSRSLLLFKLIHFYNSLSCPFTSLIISYLVIYDPLFPLHPLLNT